MRLKRAVFYAVMIALYAGASVAQNATDQNVPRFASLRSGLVNSRSGPGKKYPIEWVYKQKKAPIEIIQAFEYQQDLWYKVRDWEGSESWVHHSMISKDRTAKVINPEVNNVYAKPSYDAKIVAKVEDGVVAQIKKCPSEKEFCLLKFKQAEGWMPRKFLYGIYEEEVVK